MLRVGCHAKSYTIVNQSIVACVQWWQQNKKLTLDSKLALLASGRAPFFIPSYLSRWSRGTQRSSAKYILHLDQSMPSACASPFKSWAAASSKYHIADSAKQKEGVKIAGGKYCAQGNKLHTELRVLCCALASAGHGALVRASLWGKRQTTRLEPGNTSAAEARGTDHDLPDLQ